MPSDDLRLGLLLADETGAPVLPEGISHEKLAAAVSALDPPCGRSNHRLGPPPLPDIPQWGLIVPVGPLGDAMRAAIQPLTDLREQQQNAPARVYHVTPDEDVRAFVDREFVANDPTQPPPNYVLILGDLSHVSRALELRLTNRVYVGRLYFADTAGAPDVASFRAYANKVADWAKREATDATLSTRAKALFFTAKDGTGATDDGKVGIIDPAMDFAAKQLRRPAPEDIIEIPYDGTPDPFLEGAGRAESSVLLSLSHGAQRRSARERRRFQGAMSFKGCEIAAEMVADRVFLPGGAWVFVACFSAGTPHETPFLPIVRAIGDDMLERTVLSSLAIGKAESFVAALPQAALRNPHGPLAVIGHVDLAWSSLYVDRTYDPPLVRAGALYQVMQRLVRNQSAGLALGAIFEAHGANECALLAEFERERQKRETDPLWKPTAEDHARRCYLRMLDADLGSYMLLGDPAVRLPLRSIR